MIIYQSKKDTLQDFMSALILILDLAIKKVESHKNKETIPHPGTELYLNMRVESLRKIKDQIVGFLKVEVVDDIHR